MLNERSHISVGGIVTKSFLRNISLVYSEGYLTHNNPEFRVGACYEGLDV